MTENSSNLSRVDKAIQKLFPNLTRRQVEEAIAVGWIRRAGKSISKGDRVKSEELDCSELQRQLTEIQKGNPQLQIEIVWESEEVWVVDKPAGMPSHSLSLFDKNTVTQWALAQSPEVGKSFQEIQPTVTPHRLDTGTSGLLVVCKNKKAYEQWRERFQRKEIQKKYLAWCFGEVQEKKLEVNDPLGHHPSDARRMVAVKGLEKYRPPLLEAHTEALCLKQEGEISLWEIQCQTGVTHQVRVHMSEVGHPLVGDSLYDQHYTKRTLKPSHHQLRATELQWNGQVIRVEGSSKFSF